MEELVKIDKDLLNKFSKEEKLILENFFLQIECFKMKLFIEQHNQEEFLKQMEEKHKEK